MRTAQPYQKIPEACRTTGLSQHYLRLGCRDGTVPHIRSGRTYYVNVDKLLDRLADESGKPVAQSGRDRNCPR